jgi:hypothetical protein
MVSITAPPAAKYVIIKRSIEKQHSAVSTQQLAKSGYFYDEGGPPFRPVLAKGGVCGHVTFSAVSTLVAPGAIH